ncbi:MAG: FecR domain-containing protein [Candidatus Methylacidiphilales bacterium]
MKLFQGFSSLLLGLCSSFSFAAMEFKEAEITTLKNQVQHDAGTGTAPAKVNEKIGEKSKVTTAASSMAELTFADTSITRLGANSLFSFQSKERLIKLDQGSVLVNTPPGNGGATVDCGGVTGAVSGTTFMASRDVSGNVMFLMLEGSGTLKVTINTPTGPVSREIRPGQAATVGSASIKSAAAGDAVPGGGADAKNPENTSGGGDGGEKPAKAEPSIQVFDVDVKKIVETAPLIKEFKNELPSMEKIEKTIEKQQTAVREGKMEKMEVEMVAVKEDGDVLVGAPKVDPDDMKIVNRKDAPDAGLDIDTAAGPEGGDNVSRPTTAAAAPPPTEAARPPLAPAPNLTGGTAGLIAGEAGGAAELPPTQLAVTVRAGAVTVSFNRTVLRDRVVNLSGFAGLPGSVTILRGTSSLTLALNPAEVFPGFASITDLALAGLTLTAASDALTGSASMIPLYPLADIQAANPARLLPGGPASKIAQIAKAKADAILAGEIAKAAELELEIRRLSSDLLALDAYFYFSDKVAGVTGGPSAFFDSTSQVSLQDVAFGNVAPVELRVGQDFVFHGGREIAATPDSDAFTLPMAVDRPSLVLYGDKVSLGTTAAWTGLATGDPAIDSLNYNLLNQNAPYDFVFNENLVPGEPAGFFDSNGDLYFPKLNFPVWDDADGSLVNAVKINLESLTAGGGSFLLASGAGGFSAVGLDLQANQNRVEFQSVADLEIKTSKISGVGSGTTAEASLQLEATGKVRVGGADASEQVRFEGATAIDTLAGTEAPLPQSLAVVRSADSLEMRNLTIRNFAGTRLEKTGTDGGRILLSGSAVRDFKIKELVGAAVNADAKIQMMAVSGNGNLAGEMVVEGRLPVQAKVASALAAVGETLPTQTASAMVDAQQIDLAAQTLKFQNANLVAMNSITARANTLIIQNSFMTVVRNSGMINMYVQSGLVNRNHGTVAPGMLNFAGTSNFKIGNVLNLTIANSADIQNAITSGKMLENTTAPQAGKVNVISYF